MDQLICASLSHTRYYWYEVGMRSINQNTQSWCPLVFHDDINIKHDRWEYHLYRKKKRFAVHLQAASYYTVQHFLLVPRKNIFNMQLNLSTEKDKHRANLYSQRDQQAIDKNK